MAKKIAIKSPLSGKGIKLPKRLKKDVTPKLNASMILDEIKHYKDCEVIYFDPCSVLMMKRIEVTINRINDNSIFQPHESVEKKIYCILAMLEFTPHPLPRETGWNHYSYLKDMDCPVFRVRQVSDVDYIMKEIN